MTNYYGPQQCTVQPTEKREGDADCVTPCMDFCIAAKAIKLS